MDAQAQSDLATDARNSDLRMARTLLALCLQLQWAGDRTWPLLASAAEQAGCRLEAIAHAGQATQTNESTLAHSTPPTSDLCLSTKRVVVLSTI